MGTDVSFHRLAAREFREAFAWYRQRSVPVGRRFVEALDAALTRITDNPRGPLFDEIHRYVKMKKFPYVLFYRVIEDHIVVVAVAHASRRPGYWKRRIP